MTSQRTISLAKYLFTRLRQHHVDHVHGVPGDFTLKALDHMKAAGLKWIGNCNELNAGYAADGYARIRGLSALFTTYGVGELSAINAVAGSYAEHVPVVHIVGTPARHLQTGNRILHHSLGDTRTRIFTEIYEKVTVAQANLVDAQTATDVVDDTIRQCLKHSRPVYIELPTDMVSAEVSAEPLIEKLIIEPSPGEHQLVVEQANLILDRLYRAKQPMMMVDRGHGVPHLRDEINQLVQLARIPTLTLPSGGGMVDHSLESYFGVHSGPVGQVDTLPFVQASDLVLAFGPQYTDTQTLGWSVVPDSSKSILVGKNTIDDIEVDAKRVLQKVLQQLEPSKISHGDTTSLGNFRLIKPALANPDDGIDQQSFYLRLNDFIQEDDVIILANATPIIGGRDLVLPARAQIVASGTWFSIGHMLPAAQGISLAQNKGRTILFDGDGSFQVTAQELSTIIRYRLDATIFIINNEGYAYERQIHGMHEDYNDIAQWEYLEAPRFFGAPRNDPDYPIRTYRIQTWRDLDSLLASAEFTGRRGLKLVDVVVGKYDIPEKFKLVFQNSRNAL